MIGYMAHQYCEISPIYVSHPHNLLFRLIVWALVPRLRGRGWFGGSSTYCRCGRGPPTWGYSVLYGL